MAQLWPLFLRHLDKLSLPVGDIPASQTRFCIKIIVVVKTNKRAILDVNAIVPDFAIKVPNSNEFTVDTFW